MTPVSLRPVYHKTLQSQGKKEACWLISHAFAPPRLWHARLKPKKHTLSDIEDFPHPNDGDIP